jgi:hypothetical protein
LAVKLATGFVKVTVIYPAFVSVSLPPEFVAVSVTVYVPSITYVCEGFCAADVLPSPNDQTHDVGVLVEESTNWTARGAFPDSTVEMKDATGFVETEPTTISPALVTVLLPPAFVEVSVTVYVPAVVYVCTGLCSVDVPPSPNDQAHDVGEFVDASRNCTLSGMFPAVAFAWNIATGIMAAVLTVI